jgi:hypothetical protein
LPAPGAPANIETSDLRIIILLASNALKQLGKGSPPIDARPTDLTNVLIATPYLIFKTERTLALVHWTALVCALWHRTYPHRVWLARLG